MKEKVKFFGKPNYQFQYFLVKQLLENILKLLMKVKKKIFLN